MEKAVKNGLMAPVMKESIVMERNMEKVSLIGVMGLDLKGIFMTII